MCLAEEHLQCSDQHIFLVDRQHKKGIGFKMSANICLNPRIGLSILDSQNFPSDFASAADTQYCRNMAAHVFGGRSASSEVDQLIPFEQSDHDAACSRYLQRALDNHLHRSTHIELLTFKELLHSEESRQKLSVQPTLL